MVLSLITLLSSLLLGSMVFFAGIVTPSIFKSLDDDNIQSYTRQLFPCYYLWCIGLSGFAALLAVAAKSYIAILLLIILSGFIYGKQTLLPKISKVKDCWLASDSPQDESRYKSLHRRSVIINGFQMFMLLMIVVANLILYPRL